jgi:serine/threonine protein kinase
MDFERGIDFNQYLRNVGLLLKTSAQFYAAQIILALQYLHRKFIIYRDLKPESLIIDEYVKSIYIFISEKKSKIMNFSCLKN